LIEETWDDGGSKQRHDILSSQMRQVNFVTGGFILVAGENFDFKPPATRAPGCLK